jgi:CAAX prenyl protease-like protein
LDQDASHRDRPRDLSPPQAATQALADHAGPRGRLLAKNPWLVFLLPFIVYMVVGSLEMGQPTRENPKTRNWLGIRYEHYPAVYTAKIALTIAAMAFVWPGYRQFRFRVSPLAIAVGVVGVVLWVWLCHQGWERKLLEPIGLAKFLGLGDRPAYNPLEQLKESPAWAYAFLVIRFVGLALVVPVIEEFFLRGFMMRYVIAQDWWKWPFGQLTPMAAAIGTLFPMLMHPGELFAAAVWFSLVTALMVYTKNIWDCVAAHAVTNLLLGIYVVKYAQWQLW